MEKETQIQYSYLEHLGDTLNGNFYRSMDSSLSEIIIFYRNKTKGTTNRFANINEFIDGYCIKLKKNIKRFYTFDYALLNLRRSTKVQIRTWKLRIIYLIENKKDILITLLSRKDFDSKQAIAETILSIHDWLCTLEKNKDIADWIFNIQNTMPTFETYKVSNNKPVLENQSKKNEVSTKTQITHFWQLFRGDEIEQKRKFNNLIEILIFNDYISLTDNVGKYQWKFQGNGGRLQIAGLYFVLNNHHFKSEPTALHAEKLIGQWVIHNFESLYKLLQKKNQNTFKDEVKDYHGKSDYVKDFEKILSNL